ncbi:DH domain-containing protein [Mycena sanguinolenta]|uniref:DH domain-containing protein n=1 Tax=Mycena sanguinolenta TaxID=230812 RepID=A0A8H6XAI3_9AGAR|nr:DH domain-containing protein [Mycena sanguinolenta]
MPLDEKLRSCGDPSDLVVYFFTSVLNWRNKPVVVAGVDDDGGDAFGIVSDNDKVLPPTPRPMPPSIAQLAFPSPDESSSPSDSSNASHEPFDLSKYDVAAPRHPKKLKKPPPSSYPFSFIPENPAPEANFPYAFHRYRSTPTPTNPTPNAVAVSARPLSMHPPEPPRKLTKRRPSIPEPPHTAAPDLSMTRIVDPQPPPQPPLLRRSTLSFTRLRRKKTSSKSTLSEDGHSVLPALPPSSPLTLDIPTYRPFHARKRDSWHLQPALQPPADQRYSSPPATGDLVSEFAWTGASKALDTVLRARGGWRSAWSLSESLPQDQAAPPSLRPRSNSRPKFTLGPDEEETESPGGSPVLRPTRPPFLRRSAVASSPKRRWTLAMALADEEISDEALVEKLEALRSRSRAASFVDCPINADDGDVSEWDGVWAAYDDELDADAPPPLPPKDETLGHAQRTASMPALPSHSTPMWQSARRALLTCRELVRTERHYLASLHLLLNGGTRQPPPPLMRAMEDDPSAWGVAAAFVGAEDGVEAALVAWCGVVGAWFVDGDGSGDGAKTTRRLSKMRTGSIHGRAERDSSNVHDLNDGAEKPGTGKPAKKRGPPSPVSATSRAVSKKERDARPTVRDLAILPTQRVMRYVLLYRDLLEHTPSSSPSRALVARAVDAAMRIAQRCDRAQGNAAFLQRH